MDKQKKYLKKQEGFTLIEIIATLVIMGILASVVVMKYYDMEESAKIKVGEAMIANAVTNLTVVYASFLLTGKNPEGRTSGVDGKGNAKTKSLLPEQACTPEGNYHNAIKVYCAIKGPNTWADVNFITVDARDHSDSPSGPARDGENIPGLEPKIWWNPSKSRP